LNKSNIMSNDAQVEKASQLFVEGFNCAQAVFCALIDEDLISAEIALKLASPFGGGIARQGGVCGALSGALMALGLHLGNDEAAGKDNTYRLAGKFVEEFRGKHGSILCKDLLGVDISTQDGLTEAREGRIFDEICPLLVSQTTESLMDFMERARTRAAS
jgi:C_GCAxxG_C_C family probable redox protein